MVLPDNLPGLNREKLEVMHGVLAAAQLDRPPGSVRVIEVVGHRARPLANGFLEGNQA